MKYTLNKNWTKITEDSGELMNHSMLFKIVVATGPIEPTEENVVKEIFPSSSWPYDSRTGEWLYAKLLTEGEETIEVSVINFPYNRVPDELEEQVAKNMADILVNAEGVTASGTTATTNTAAISENATDIVTNAGEIDNLKSTKADIATLNSAIALSAYGIKYKWATVEERNAEAGMINLEQGVQVDNRTVYKYNGSAWEVHYTLDAIHNHDDRYNTKAEILALLSNASTPTHEHTMNEVTGLQEDLDNKATAIERNTSNTDVNSGEIDNLKSTKQDKISGATDVAVKGVTVTGHIVPEVDLGPNIGSAIKRFKEAWIETLHLGLNTLYIGDTAVLGTSGDTVDIKADADQHILIKTIGVGTSKMISENGVELSTSGVNADVLLQALGAGARVVVGSNTEIVYTAPNTTFNGDMGITGHATVETLTVTGDVTFAGDKVLVHSKVVVVEDNIIVLNSGEVGNGVTAGQAGFRVDRGELVDQLLVFDDVIDAWVYGPIGGPYTVIPGKDTVDANTALINAIITNIGSTANLKTENKQIVTAINEVHDEHDGLKADLDIATGDIALLRSDKADKSELESAIALSAYGIKYKWPSSAERVSTVDMIELEQGVQIDNRTVYKFVGGIWEVHYTLDATHNHDGLYYTKSQVTSALAGKSGTGHVHTIDNIAGLQADLNQKNTAIAGKANKLEPPVTLSAGTYSDFPLDKDFYLCNCTAGDIIISTLSVGAEIGKTVIFKKVDSSVNKIVLKNVTNGGFVEDTRTSDLEITEQFDSVVYCNI